MKEKITSFRLMKASISSIICTLLVFSMLPASQAQMNHQTTPYGDNSSPQMIKPQPSFAPGQLIVKFTPEIGAAAKTIFSEKRLFSEITHTSTLDDLNEKYQVRSLVRVFQSLEQKGQLLGKEVVSYKEISEQLREQYPLRSNRATGSDVIPDLENVYLLTFSGDYDVSSAVAVYSKDPSVVYAEPNYYAQLAWTPNDPYFHSSGSWGQSYPDLWGLHKIGCEVAWDTARGQGITVAVVDSGLDATHEDIHANIWVNTLEIPGNGIDDDHNGYIDDINGWNFAGNTPSITDKIGHGSHCSGTIAATGNNSIGVVGVAPLAQVMPLKIFDLDNQGNPQDAPVSGIAAAVEYAVSNGADIISNSWGFNNQMAASEVQVLLDALNAAHSLGCVLVFASGNDNRDIGSERFGDIPAALENVITVGASDHLDQKSDFSNYGVKLDVCAPGGDSHGIPPFPERNILSIRADSTDVYGDQFSIVGQRYYRAEGTSMACPHVAGLAALILSNHPSFTNEEVRQIIRASCDDINPLGWDIGTGYGRINASKALQFTSAVTTHISSPKLNTFVGGTINILGTASGPDFFNYRVEYGMGLEPSSWTLITEQSSPVTNGNLATNWNVSQVFGVITVRLTSTDMHGQQFFDRITVNHFLINITVDAVKGVLFGVSARLTNTGAATASDVAWNITVLGGAFGFIHSLSESTISSLAPGDTATIRTSGLIFGLGRIEITIEVVSGETWVGTGTVFGPFVMGVTRA